MRCGWRKMWLPLLREGPNFAVDWAEDGLTGLDLAENGCYDLMILDLMLPGLDGLGLLKKVRARGDAHTGAHPDRQRRG